MSVPNLKRIALFVQKLLGGPKFRPTADPLLGARDGQNLITGDGHYLYLQTQFGEDRCTQFRVIVVTDPQTHRQGRLKYTALLSLVCSVMIIYHCIRTFQILPNLWQKNQLPFCKKKIK